MVSGRRVNMRRWTSSTFTPRASVVAIFLFCWMACLVVDGKDITGNIGRVISRRGQLHTGRRSCRLHGIHQQTSRRRSPEAILSTTMYPSPFCDVVTKEKVTSLRRAVVSVVDDAWETVRQCLPPEVLMAHEMEWKGVTSLLAVASLSQDGHESLSSLAALQSLLGVPLSDQRGDSPDSHMADWYHGLLAHTALYRDPIHSPEPSYSSYSTQVVKEEDRFVPRLARVLDNAISSLRMVCRMTTDPAVLLAAYVAGGIYGRDVDTPMVAALLSRLPQLTRTLVLQSVAMETASLSSSPLLPSNKRRHNQSSMSAIRETSEAEFGVDVGLFRPLPSIATRPSPSALSTATAATPALALTSTPPPMTLHLHQHHHHHAQPPSRSIDHDDEQQAARALQETLLQHAQQFCPYDQALFSIAMSLRAVRLQQLNPLGGGQDLLARWDSLRADADQCRRSILLRRQQRRQRRQWLPPVERHRLALDTLQLWAPLSFRLALAKFTPELEWHAYGLLFPTSFDAFLRWYQAFVPVGQQVIHTFRQVVEEAIRRDPIVDVVLDDDGAGRHITIDLTRVCRRLTIQARVKSPASTFKKMLRRGSGSGGGEGGRRSPDHVRDLIGVRIIASLRPTLPPSDGGGGGGGSVTGDVSRPLTDEEAETKDEPFVIDFDDTTATDRAPTTSTTTPGTAMAHPTDTATVPHPPPWLTPEKMEAIVVRALHRRIQLLPQWCEDGHRRKDYIQQPKPSGYQSLHTSMMHVETGHRVELQIRSARMHWEAEHGPASHNVYKVLALPSTQQLPAPEETRPFIRSM